jgi:Xaa-Pro aminopeptidase
VRDNAEELKKSFDNARIDALFIVKRANQRYLEGFTGADCFLLASPGKNYLIADSRYVEMAAEECRTAEVVPHRAPHPPLAKVISNLARDNGWKRVGFEKDRLTGGMYDEIARAAAPDLELAPTSSIVERIRAKKTPEEAAMVEAACRIADRALEKTLPLVKPGVSELDVKIELDYKLKTEGAEDVSFDTMVLFGARASQPHANARKDARLVEGDFVLIDFGA